MAIDDGSRTTAYALPRGAATAGKTGREVSITDYVADGAVIDDVLATLDEDDVIIEFPPGTYKLGEFHTNSDGIELVAPDGDVTLDIIGTSSTALKFSGDQWRIRGFEFDYRGRPPKQIRAAGSGWAIDDCVWRGVMDWPSSHPSQAIAAQVDFVRGAGRIHGCYFHEGSGDGHGRAIRVLPESVGTLWVQLSWFEHWADPAVDARDANGGLRIAECYVRNSTGGLRLNGPAQVIRSTFVCDGDVPTAAATGDDRMRLWLAGDRRTDEEEVYLEDCDFCWFSSADTAAGHPIDDRDGVERLQLYSCRLHNETRRASVAIGDGRVDFYRTQFSGTGDRIQNTGGLIGKRELRTASGVGARATPPIPDPPAVGETPTTRDAGSVALGRPGGSAGRFYRI